MDAQIATLTAALTSVVFMLAPVPKSESTSKSIESIEQIERLTEDVAICLGVSESESNTNATEKR